MTAIPVAPSTGTTLVPATTAWWICPSWCTDCSGGETLTGADGPDFVVARDHRHVLLNTIVDGERVAVEVAAFEDLTDGYFEPAVVIVDAGRAALGPEAAAAFVRAVSVAVALAGQPLPAIGTRPSFVPVRVGRASIPLEAS